MHKSHITALFGGIGGFELGLERSGHRTGLFCECDPEAAAVLFARFPGVPIHPDVRRIDELAEIAPQDSDLLTAGFPCVDLSQAGRTQGLNGEQSGLIRSVWALLKRRPYRDVLIENVSNLRVLHGGKHLGAILYELEALGYRWAYRVIDALAWGLPQRRHRIFLFATLDGDPREILFHGDEEPQEDEYRLDEAAHGFYWTEGNRGLGWGENCVPTLKGGSALGVPSPPAILMPDGRVVTPDIRDAERLQGFEAGWTDCRVAYPPEDGQPFRQRRRWVLVGNAVNVEVSTWLGERLALREKYDGPSGEVLHDGAKWPIAAWYDGKVRRWVKLGTWPVSRPRQSLAEFLRYPPQMLSRKAVAGFYSRIIKSNLKLRDGFKPAIKRHLDTMEALEASSIRRIA